MKPEDRIPVKDVSEHDMSTGSVALYEAREKIHPKSVEGIFERVRVITVWATMGLYLVLPWIQWNGRQAVLFDLQAREFFIFGLTFYPQDMVLLSMLLMISAFGLLTVTVLAGRVYCGYVCPQTVWTRFFIWIEDFLEGDRNARLRLDKSPWTLNKLWRRGAKHFLWLSLALLTAVTFVGYFSPITSLSFRLFTLDLGGWEAFWMTFFTLATYTNAGWMREQVCKYMCPYARFQSVMFDANSLIVSYDPGRGEPRARGARRQQDTQTGDCIDCGLCVQVCPVGIDIRNGLQYECIACAACIDACDNVMETIGKPKGLIRYTTERALEGKKTQFIRPRLLGYGSLMTIMVIVFMTTLLLRVPVDLDVIRDRGALYRINADGFIENSYRLEVRNMSQQPGLYTLSFKGPDGLTLIAPEILELGPGQHVSVPVTLHYDPFYHDIDTGNVYFEVQKQDDPSTAVERKSRFFSPD